MHQTWLGLALSLHQCSTCSTYSALLLWDLKKCLTQGKGLREDLPSPVEHHRKSLKVTFLLFFSVGWKTTDGLWNPVIVNVTELLRHYLPSFHASRPWCAAVEEGGGELENITGPSPWDTQVKTLGKVRNRLGYDPTRIYIYLRIFWGQLPELRCSEPDCKEVKKTVWDMDITHLLPSGCKALSLLHCPHHRYTKPLIQSSTIDSWYCIYLIILKKCNISYKCYKRVFSNNAQVPKRKNCIQVMVLHCWSMRPETLWPGTFCQLLLRGN